MAPVSEKDFKFHIPVELQKSEEDGEWRVQGIASTPDQDLQGEIVDQHGLDISALKAGRGLFNFDHLKGPENILGQIEDAEFMNIDGKKVLKVDGYLFKENDRSKGMYAIMKGIKKGNSPRVHMSIEGKILERDFMNQKKIKKARIDKVALTLDPVNPYTYAELVKSLTAESPAQISENIEQVKQEEETVTLTRRELTDVIEYAISKALSAGAPSGPAVTKVGGEAMQSESLDKKPKTMTYKEKNKKTKKEMIKSVIDSLKKAHPDRDPWELAEMVIEAFMVRNLKESQRD